MKWKRAARSLLDAIENAGRCGRGNRERLDAVADRRGRLCRGQTSGGRGVDGDRREQVQRWTTIAPVPVLAVDPDLEAEQVKRLPEWKRERDQGLVDAALEKVTKAANGADNLLYPMKEALVAGATVGEVSRCVARGVRGVPAMTTAGSPLFDF